MRRFPLRQGVVATALGLCTVAALSPGCSRQTGPPATASAATTPPPQQTVTTALTPQDVATRLAEDLSHAPPNGIDAAGWTDVKRLYGPAPAPLWVGATEPNADGHAALDLLRGAKDEGLEPDDYHVPGLTSLAGRPFADSAEAATFDAMASAGVLRYLKDLHLGRVDPRVLGFRLQAPPDTHDMVAIVRTALAAHRLPAAARDLRPAIGQYEALRAMLSRYRALAASGPDVTLPEVSAGVRPGSTYAGAAALRARLRALGDLPDVSLPRDEQDRYDPTLAAGVTAFQHRHGIDADGVLGRRTIEALNVPLAWRVRQIELALERLRWLPDLGHDPLVAINIPMFRLWAWDDGPSKNPALSMAVIVGQSIKWQTPVFDRQLREVVFQPYWNVPRSILRQEILPKMRRDADYLGREHLELVDGLSDSAPAVEPTTDNLARLQRGELRLRQRPGPENALGGVKFVFPNEDDVYMHGTPATELFLKSRRDFSHGCVRVERPEDLAAWALRDLPEWDRDRIAAAMTGPSPRTVRLSRPIRVLLFYTTAAVMSSTGVIHFADDIYGRDQPLDAALRRP